MQQGPGAVAPGGGDRVAAIAAAKTWARIEGEGETALLGTMVDAAYALAEAFTGQVLIAREIVVVRPASPWWGAIGVAPVTGVARVRGVPADGAAFDLPVEGYAIDIDAEGDAWLRVTQPGAGGRVEVTLTAGIAADWASLPPPIAQGIVHLAADRFMARDRDLPPPAAVAALWRPFRRMRLSSRRRASA
ncbi:head-tail connector protein [Sphingomonas japonica]|uniref:PhiE125 gp8 family phage protein n=1 Tax=Sphingomonas japonica TaxID=511662 RepID=A0ABX0TZI5_9SPHN|nr:hypothetical protein [Sphingomonas japonica]NIJ23729.1 putative phiE125 gp8 family phage protein [Sphingomonas japonica]